jgi:hypothetical protein
MIIFMGVLGSCLSIWPKAKNASRFSGWLARCWLFGGVLCLATFYNLGSAKSADNYKATHYKQYILISLNYNFQQAYCLIDLYHHESRFDPKAKNGSHYGIPQGRSEYLKTATGIKQISWGVRYIGNRYGWVDKANGVPNACNAWQHFLKKGWH